MKEEITFMVKVNPEVWKSIGINSDRLEKMRQILSEVYSRQFLSQKIDLKRWSILIG